MLILLSYIHRGGIYPPASKSLSLILLCSLYKSLPTRYTRMGPALTCSLVSSLLCCWTTVPLFSVLLELVVLDVLTLLMLLVLLCFSENVFDPAPEFELVSKSSSSLACFSSNSSCLWARMSCRRVVSWNIYQKNENSQSSDLSPENSRIQADYKCIVLRISAKSTHRVSRMKYLNKSTQSRGHHMAIIDPKLLANEPRWFNTGFEDGKRIGTSKSFLNHDGDATYRPYGTNW